MFIWRRKSCKLDYSLHYFEAVACIPKAIIPSTCKVLKRLKKYVLKSYLRWEENIHVQRVDSCLHNTTSAQLLRGVGGSLIWVVTQYF